MAVNTSNPFQAIHQLIEETNKDLSILQEGVEKEITNEPLITADQEDSYEAILIEDEGVVREDQPNDKITVADIEDKIAIKQIMKSKLRQMKEKTTILPECL